MKKHFLWAIYFGFGAAGLLIVAVFLTGNTFGQRCAKIWPESSSAWSNCVERFAHGSRALQ
jgi:hypothetical protein